ncbi:WD repeat-containing protein 78-like [Anneissia japonica]|uniref:WD repeat-containing protein 78-like n=1 Tax=Anneissia japonica TaxID=1529436 RepID=UPI0014256164|nr:WD repeat-containing protein 78-like [Anneissia japonica]
MSIEKSKTGNMLKVNTHSHSTITRSKVSTMSQSRLGGKGGAQIANASRATMSSSRRSNTALESNIDGKMPPSKSHVVQVFDEAGNDVTPQPLLIIDPNTVKHNQSKIFGADSGGGTPTDLMSQNSIYQTGTTSFAAPFRRSIFGTSMTQSGRSTPESFTDVIIEPTEGPDIVTGLADVQTRREEVAETLTEDDLDKIHEITLSESEMFWLLDMPGVCISAESDEAAEVKKRNEDYKQLCSSKEGNDRYMNRGMQCFNEALKTKDIQTTKIAMIDEESTACTWDMYDTYLELDNKQATDETATANKTSSTHSQRAGSSTPQAADKQQSAPGSITAEGGTAYPERVFHCEAGVTSMDFSVNNPNLLAVGLYDGTVAIYNVRSMKDEPALDSYESNAKHSAPVWELKWIEKDRGSGEDKGEMLISISTDGRVSQWQIRKGFECADLMKLKRVATKGKRQNKDGREVKSEALISRHASGFCFDFSPKDANIYLAGTEDGLIHKCSCSYNEQYLDSYHGHTGPVYRIEWSPFLPDVFLSCSNDWSIRLWQQDHLQPVLNFFSSTKSVMDVCWSPTSASVFGCVNEGAIEIWDVDQNTLDPLIVSVPAPGVKLSCLTFAHNSDVSRPALLNLNISIVIYFDLPSKLLLFGPENLEISVSN